MPTRKFAFCPYCGTKLTENQVTCPNCHRKLPIEEAAKKSRPSLNQLISNPYKEGMDRYHEKASGTSKKKKRSFWRKLL